MIAMMTVAGFVNLEHSIEEIMMLTLIIQEVHLEDLIRYNHHLEAKIQVIME